jgi:hypothetical protein
MATCGDPTAHSSRSPLACRLLSWARGTGVPPVLPDLADVQKLGDVGIRMPSGELQPTRIGLLLLAALPRPSALVGLRSHQCPVANRPFGGEENPVVLTAGTFSLNQAGTGNTSVVNFNGGELNASTIRLNTDGTGHNFNWNDGTISHRSSGNLILQRSAGATTNLIISLAETGTHTLEAASGRTITVSSTATSRHRRVMSGCVVPCQVTGKNSSAGRRVCRNDRASSSELRQRICQGAPCDHV